MEGSLNYTRLFAQKHRIGALFLYNHKIYKLLTAENQKKSLPYKSQDLLEAPMSSLPTLP